MEALVVGGTGPTGPHIVLGLLERGYEVTILHRGTHETSELPDGVEHIHADPHFRDTFDEALAGRTFETVVSTYGRIRLQADVLKHRCNHFIGIGGVTVYLGNAEPQRADPFGMKLLAREDDRLAVGLPGPETKASKFVERMVATEQTIFQLHDEGAFNATWFRYPIVYGPRNVIPWEWSIIKRVRDDRRRIILPDGGLGARSRSFARNAAHAVLLAVDRPEAAHGEIFNVAEDGQFTLRQWVDLLNDILNGQLVGVSLPWRLAMPSHIFFPFRGTGSPHVIVDTSKIRHRLGYSDVVDPRAALEESVAWYEENPVTSKSHPNFPDRFDYHREDQLIDLYTSAAADIEDEVGWPEGEVIHNYAHPRKPGQQRDHRGR